ncbi:hypothetical protein GH714_028480 [Hevea brasiliensis]|uniref:alpha-1,2-Mannosidase n=1 Tax=Hevea brasiliensis TaxID=3981 RepID=A0A6A6MQI0_HEVBR|nr:hypothetical protein GH714_028480 [Hevea brasiliensis]
MSSELIKLHRENAEIYHGEDLCRQKFHELLESFSLPRGVLPLDIIELGYNRSTGFIWLKQKNKKVHKFHLINRTAHYDTEVTAFIEKGRLRNNERRGVLDVEPLVLGWFFWGSFGLDCMGCGRRESNVRDDKEEEKREVQKSFFNIRLKPMRAERLRSGAFVLEGNWKGTTDISYEIGRLNTDPIWLERQQKVKEAFIHAWSGYKKYAMGYDELVPLSQRGVDGLGGLGATSMDALDTAMIMGANEVVSEAGSWIETHLSNRIAEKGQVNLFDTAIRVLGGLLSAYHLSGGEQGTKSMHEGPKPIFYLETARNLADCLLVAFTSSPTPIPFSDVVLHDSAKHCAPDGLAVLQKFQLFSWSGVQLSQYHFW